MSFSEEMSKAIAKHEFTASLKVIQSRLSRRGIKLSLSVIREYAESVNAATIGDYKQHIELIYVSLLSEHQGEIEPIKAESNKLVRPKPQTYDEHLKEAGLNYSRMKLEEIYGKKLTRQQWLKVLSVSENLGFISHKGVIPEIHLKTFSQILTIRKSLATTERVRFYMETLKKLQNTDELLLGIVVKENAKKIAMEHKPDMLLDGIPSEPTLYSWFNRSGLKYKAHRRYTPEEATEVYLRAMF